MAPPLIIICGAFTATGVLLQGVDWLFHGRNRRVRITDFERSLDLRDIAIKNDLKKLAEVERLNKLASGAGISPKGHHH